MDSQTVRIIGGTHRGKQGTVVSHTSHFTWVNIGEKSVRCKTTFIENVGVPAEQQQEQPQAQQEQQQQQEQAQQEQQQQQEQAQQEQAQQEPDPDMIAIQEQERILKQIQDSLNAQHSQMIAEQNKVYEECVKKDLELFKAQEEAAALAKAQAGAVAQAEAVAEAQKPVFEEVSVEEMRRVRLARFG